MAIARLEVRPVNVDYVLKDKIYDALKQAIVSMNVYAHPEEPRLDKRQLAKDLGVSRTPIREAIARLEQEGFVRTVPRKGVFVVRKTKKEVLEMITVWAALESMAARLITLQATDQEISTLRSLFTTFENNQLHANIDEYSEANIRFHQAILRMSRCGLLNELAQNLFLHMRWIRTRTISESDRASRSIIDHMNIIEALEARDTDLAERLVRQHTLDLAEHVRSNVRYFG
jgi:DNA-binding GntR family transcriptional regulator